MSKQLCPLCDSPATHSMSHDPECKHFTCPVCLEFFIDESSERYLNLFGDTQTDLRSKLSAAARKTRSDRVFVIREPRPEERGGDGRSVARLGLISEYIRR